MRMFAISRLLRLRERWRYKAKVMLCGDPATGLLTNILWNCSQIRRDRLLEGAGDIHRAIPRLSFTVECGAKIRKVIVQVVPEVEQ